MGFFLFVCIQNIKKSGLLGAALIPAWMSRSFSPVELGQHIAPLGLGMWWKVLGLPIIP